jgi:copper chaperone
MSEGTITAEYTVLGMSCSHCVSSVSEEVSEVGGVQDVNVDLGTGRLTVTFSGAADHAAVRAAVGEAGYQVEDPS